MRHQVDRFDGACLIRNVIYQATVFPENQGAKTYIGMTEGEFKTRFCNHQQSLSNKKYASSTSLSKYIWELKEAKTKYKIKWSILKRANAYRSGGKQCMQPLSGGETLHFKSRTYFKQKD